MFDLINIYSLKNTVNAYFCIFLNLMKEHFKGFDMLVEEYFLICFAVKQKRRYFKLYIVNSAVVHKK